MTVRPLLAVGGTRARRDPLAHVRHTDPQRAFCSLDPVEQRLALWRGGNQIGKSYGLAYDIVHTARGTHPLRRLAHRPPVTLLVGGYSWKQMDPLLEKLWEFLPKGEIDPKIRYQKKQGIRGHKDPVITFERGPGAGSVIALFTYEQGPSVVMGDSIHAAYLDEPPPEAIYGEIIPRLSHHRGFLRIGMTPTPESPPLDYLRDLVAKGKVYELQTSITVENVTLRGGLLDYPLRSAAEIEADLDDYLEIERGMREHGDWEPVLAGRWLTAYGDACFGAFYPDEEVYLAVGLDHGAKAGRQCAVLVACATDGSKVWVLDEARSDGRTSSEEDARAILAMLARHQWTWKDVDYWVGDRAHGGDQAGNEKSNSLLLDAFADVLGVNKRGLRAQGLRLVTPRKHNRSVVVGCRFANSLFKQKRLLVNLRCQGLNDSIRRWEGKRDDPHKDPIDALRYALEELRDAKILRKDAPAMAAIYR